MFAWFAYATRHPALLEEWPVDRSMLFTMLFVFGCTLTGFVVSVFVVESDMPVVSGLLGTGGGAMIGSFIAALATDEPLIGGKTDMALKRPRPPRNTESSTEDRDASKAL